MLDPKQVCALAPWARRPRMPRTALSERPTVSETIESKVRAQLKKGTRFIKTAKLLGIGVVTVQRVKTAHLSLPI